MFGILNINKPRGFTSRDAVDRVQRVVRSVAGKGIKVGHAGTLDPIATGVLIVCIGSATRLIERLHRMEKRYVGVFQMGRRSPSDDIELPVEELSEPPVPSLLQIESAIPKFLGNIQQVPPTYSAVKIAGKKSYHRVRRGETVTLPPRSVLVHGLEVVRYDYPELVLSIHCGSGTYVRSLGRDLAALLGTAAVMSGLERTVIGPFSVDDALDPRELSPDSIQDRLASPSLALGDLPRRRVTPTEEIEIRHGRSIVGKDPKASEIALLDEQGNLLALATDRVDGRTWPTRVFR